MKNLLICLTLTLSAAAVFAEAPKDPNPFSDYGVAMASTPGKPMAVEWQDKNRAAIDAATEPDVLAAFVEDAESAARLLVNVRDAYTSDPLAMTQIAAVTQWVMTEEPSIFRFWAPSPAKGRKVWVAALEKKMASSHGYIATFCRQQLDLCGYGPKDGASSDSAK